MRIAAGSFRIGGVAWACLALAAALQAQEDKGPARKPFEVRMLKLGDTYQGVRFKPATGETWQIRGDKWEKLAEGEAPPAGEYDVILIPAGEIFVALRLERATGATWLMAARKWNRIKEPAAKEKEKEKEKEKAKMARAGQGFELRHFRVGEQLHVIRFHRGTGAAAHIERDAYEALAETGPVPAGDYDITIITTETQWMAFRLEADSGSFWLLRKNQWDKASEPE
jgi:hypothetical protein